MYYYLRSLNYPEKAYRLPLGESKIGTNKNACDIVIPDLHKGVLLSILHGLKNTKDPNSPHVFQISKAQSSICVIKAGLCETTGGAVLKPGGVIDLYPWDIIVVSGGTQRLLLLESPRPLTEHEQQHHLCLRDLLLTIMESPPPTFTLTDAMKMASVSSVQTQGATMSSIRELEKRYPNFKVPPLCAYFDGKCNKIACVTQSENNASANNVSENSTATEDLVEPPAKRAKEDESTQKRPSRFCAAFERRFLDKVVEAEAAEMSLDNFKYYLSDSVKCQLIGSAYVFLRQPENAHHVRGMCSSLWRSMILNGPSGTDLYQEALGRALAKHFGARVLVLDRDDFATMRRRIFRRRKRRLLRMRLLRSSFLRLRGEEEEVISVNNSKMGASSTGCSSDWVPPGQDLGDCGYDDYNDENDNGDDDDDYTTGGGVGPGAGDNDDDYDDMNNDDPSAYGDGNGPYDDDDDYDYDYDYGEGEDDDDEEEEDDDYDDYDDYDDDDGDDDDDPDHNSGDKYYGGNGYGYGAGDYNDEDDDDDDDEDDEEDEDGNGNGDAYDFARASNNGSAKGGLGDRQPTISVVIYQPGKFTQRFQKISQPGQQDQLQPGSPRRPFSRGDPVEYVQHDPCLVAMKKSLPLGARGRVVVPFAEDDKTYGVEFYKPFPGGTDLGGMCRAGCGAFVATTSLVAENPGMEIETSLVDALFAIAAQRKPLVVIVKDAVNLLVRSPGAATASRCSRFVSLLERIDKEKLPVVFLGTSTGSLPAAYGASINSNPVEPQSPDDGIDFGLGGSSISITGSASFPLSSIAGFFTGAGNNGNGGGNSNGSNVSVSLSGLSSITSIINSIAATAGNFLRQYSSSSGLGKDDSMRGSNSSNSNSNSNLLKLFPRRIEVVKPKDSAELEKWAAAIKRDTEWARLLANAANILRLLDRFRLSVEGVPSASAATALEPSALRSALAKQLGAAGSIFALRVLRPSELGHILAWAAANAIRGRGEEAQEEGDAEERAGGRLLLRVCDLSHGAAVFSRAQPSKAVSRLAEIEPENEYEHRILADVVLPEDIRVSFTDIGALDGVKEVLREAVALPLQRPELFRRGNLAKPTKGILLFGPPGTGKTMLARAIATESGAAFINISMASLTSKLYGDDEKIVRALFSVAHKLAPCVIFVDEVDSLLGSRDSTTEHEMTRKIKNEFMAAWDGLRTSQTERVLVLAATNRPMDLDDAVLRRFTQRIMVDLPDAENREKILRVILENEDLENKGEFDFKDLARKTEGYSGSDLKNLCVYAAHQPVREFLSREKEEKEAREAKGEKEVEVEVEVEEDEDEDEDEDDEEAKERRRRKMEEKKEEVSLRPLVMNDFDLALAEVGKSVGGTESMSTLEELRSWNKIYGNSDNGDGKNSLYYFA